MTGNRSGISDEALKILKKFLSTNDIIEVHHGDCIGADTAFHKESLSNGIKIVIHPPNKNNFRSFCIGDNVTILLPKPYLTRNHHIVDATDMLIAFPPTKEEIVRSGTWATIRYAKKKHKKIFMIFADGEISKIN